eukprot:COSAG01_NODE_38359_length_490_cov_3.007673_1_plen_134_part_01
MWLRQRAALEAWPARCVGCSAPNTASPMGEVMPTHDMWPVRPAVVGTAQHSTAHTQSWAIGAEAGGPRSPMPAPQCRPVNRRTQALARAEAEARQRTERELRQVEHEAAAADAELRRTRAAIEAATAAAVSSSA